MQVRRLGTALVVGTAVLLAVGVGGGAIASPPPQSGEFSSDVGGDALQQQQMPEARRALLEALARLAGVSPQELRAAAQEHGGLLQALEALGVTQEQVLDALAEQIRRSFDPAVAEGRLSPEQADHLAQDQARRCLCQLGGTLPRVG